ncbi:hypothetical protein [Borrelia turcica]|nr:hypothetical protein [Borrelia turcica]
MFRIKNLKRNNILSSCYCNSFIYIYGMQPNEHNAKESIYLV